MAASETPLDDRLRERTAARKRVELEQKLGGIRAELEHWVSETASGKPLRKHRSQIQRLTDQLTGMVDGVGEELRALPEEADRLLSQSRPMQMRVLEVHRLWDYFRSKLNLRYVEWFADHLAAADELAWDCYEPARRAAASSPEPPAVRAAPLVFFTGEFSPYTHARAARYDVEPLPDVVDSEDFLAIAAELPIPVIGLPWYQLAHLPDAPLVGHEIGHDVEHELALTSAMERHLAPVLSGHDDPAWAFAWRSWRAELFADIYGVLCTGPAFVAAMADLLATDPVQVVDEARSPATWDPHPPASLRMRALTHELGRLGFDVQGQALRKTWEAAFPPDPRDPFIDDVAAVVDALWDGRYPQLDGPLHSAIAFSTEQHRLADAVADTVLMGMPPEVDDIRCLIAGARLAFDIDPERYRSPRAHPDKRTAQQLILDHVLALRSDEPRHEELDREPAPGADHEAGRDLLQRIQRKAAASTPDRIDRGG